MIIFTDIDWYNVPLSGFSFLANVQAEKCQMEQRAIVPFLTFKDLKTQEIERELTWMYGDQAIQISAVKK
jgi:hypothetical protein